MTRAEHPVFELIARVHSLARVDGDRVGAELALFVADLESRRRTCFRCATETIGKYLPKRRQRSFCSRECSSAQAHEDFSARRNRAASAR